MEQTFKLSEFSKGSGCGCKIGPEMLEKILKGISLGMVDPKLIVGNETMDDAAVYQLDGDMVLVSTTDFFTPIVDDAFDFGRIAAANALSDVYAMGAKPSFALVILGWPVEKLPLELCSKVMDGARQVCNEAGVVIAGGHSVDVPEPLFGLAVTGFAHKDHIKKNNSPQEGDLLILSKPLGTGVYSSAMKRGLLQEADKTELLENITKLNSIGEKLGAIAEVHAMTDITGFGLAGHLCEMMANTGFQAEINFNDLPIYSNLQHYLSQYIFPDNTTRNYNACKSKVEGLDGIEFLTVCDPQTNGGLLISVSEDKVDEIQKLLKPEDLATVIGRIRKSNDGFLVKLLK